MFLLNTAAKFNIMAAREATLAALPSDADSDCQTRDALAVEPVAPLASCCRPCARLSFHLPLQRHMLSDASHPVVADHCFGRKVAFKPH